MCCCYKNTALMSWIELLKIQRLWINQCVGGSKKFRIPRSRILMPPLLKRVCHTNQTDQNFKINSRTLSWQCIFIHVASVGLPFFNFFVGRGRNYKVNGDKGCGISKWYLILLVSTFICKYCNGFLHISGVSLEHGLYPWNL